MCEVVGAAKNFAPVDVPKLAKRKSKAGAGDLLDRLGKSCRASISKSSSSQAPPPPAPPLPTSSSSSSTPAALCDLLGASERDTYTRILYCMSVCCSWLDFDSKSVCLHLVGGVLSRISSSRIANFRAPIPQSWIWTQHLSSNVATRTSRMRIWSMAQKAMKMMTPTVTTTTLMLTKMKTIPTSIQYLVWWNNRRGPGGCMQQTRMRLWASCMTSTAAGLSRSHAFVVSRCMSALCHSVSLYHYLVLYN